MSCHATYASVAAMNVDTPTSPNLRDPGYDRSIPIYIYILHTPVGQPEKPQTASVHLLAELRRIYVSVSHIVESEQTLSRMDALFVCERLQRLLPAYDPEVDFVPTTTLAEEAAEALTELCDVACEAAEWQGMPFTTENIWV